LTKVSFKLSCRAARDGAMQRADTASTSPLS
jgi:hypothetical protein